MKYLWISAAFFFAPLVGAEKESSKALTSLEEHAPYFLCEHCGAEEDQALLSLEKLKQREQCQIEESTLYRSVVHNGLTEYNTSFHLLEYLIKKNYRSVLTALFSKNPSLLHRVDKKGNNLLHYAVFHGNTEIALLLLENGLSPFEPNEAKQAPIHKAFATLPSSALHQMLEYEHDALGIVDEQGCGLMYYAVYYKRPATLKLLMEKGGDINQKTKKGCTPLMLALSRGLCDMAECLIMDDKIDTTVRDNNKNNSLDYAIEGGFLSLVIKLMEKGTGSFSLATLGYTQHLARLLSKPYAAEWLKELSERGTIFLEEEDKEGATFLHYAARHNNISLMNFLIAYGIDPNKKDESGRLPLHYFSFSGQKPLDALSEYLNQCAAAHVNVSDNQGKTALHYAVMQNNSEAVSLLLQYGANVNAVDHSMCTPLQKALIVNDNHELVSILLSHPELNFDAIRLRDEEGLAFLYYAAQHNKPEVVAWLLEKGVNPNIVCYEGRTVLQTALLYESFEVVKALLSCSNVEVNARDNEGDTAFHYAVEPGDKEILTLLLEKGAHPEISNRAGLTPLHEAAKQGNREVVAWLVEVALVNIHIRDNEGKTALDWAIEEGWHDISSFLHYKEPLLEQR